MDRVGAFEFVLGEHHIFSAFLLMPYAKLRAHAVMFFGGAENADVREREFDKILLDFKEFFGELLLVTGGGEICGRHTGAHKIRSKPQMAAAWYGPL